MGVADSLAQIQSSAETRSDRCGGHVSPLHVGKRYLRSFIGSFRPIYRCLGDYLCLRGTP
jgi:hypothetical protein